MNVLVTGGEGMLGRALERRFAAGGHEVTAIGRDRLDVTDGAAVAAHVDARARAGGGGYALVLHTAAWTDVDACEGDAERARIAHVEGTRHPARAAAGCGARLVAISTDYVFAGDVHSPRVETDRPNPRSVYGRTKFDGESAAWREHPAPLIVRSSGLYGAGGTHFPGAIRARIEAGEPLRVVDDQFASPTWAVDLADAIFDLVAVPDASGLFHVANRGPVSWYDMACEIARALGKAEHPIEPITSDQLNRPAPRPAYSALDSGKFEATVGRPMRSWQDALREFLQS